MKNSSSIYLTIYLSIYAIVAFSYLGFSQNLDSVSYYNGDGTLSWWYLQKDVLLFQCQNGEEYSGYLDTFVVEDINYFNEEASQFNELILNSNATLSDLIVLKDSIIASGQLRMFAPVLTKFPYNANVQQRYYRTDDQLLVTFHDPNIDSVTIQNFMDEYRLKLIHKPSTVLSNSTSWGYVFRLDLKSDTILNTILMANIIATYEPNLVKIVTPNIIGGDYLVSCESVTEMSLSPGGISGTWHLRNEGQIIWNGYSGVSDADADICECWGAGYTGEGIKIGIIDVGGFESDHPDLKPFENGFNALNSQYITPNNNTYSNFNHHGMAVAGVIGATPNNTNLGQRFAAGVAYDASLHPFLVDLTSAQILVALQNSVELSMDVVNMSFRIPFSPNISNQLTNMATTTRYVNGQFRGMVLVAATGNDNLESFNFPANHLNVIGVGMTNPDDYRSNYGLANSWTINPGDGSTYGSPSYNYDVVAPGEVIMALDLKGANGYGAGDYIVTTGTSFSSPIVAGIAAMLLQKNPNLTYTEVRNLIRNGAEKVRPTTYNYNMFPGFPGYNNEMFYGRVSCINSLYQVLDVEQKTLQKLTIQHISKNDYILILPNSKDFQYVEIVDAIGQIIWGKNIYPYESQLEFSLENFSSGLFFLNLYENSQIIGSQKLVR